jgi:hypothetical protein
MVYVLYHDYSYLNELFDEIYKENRSSCLHISNSIYKKNQEKLKELIENTAKIVNNNHFNIDSSNYYIEFHKYFVNGKKTPFFNFRQDDGGAVHYDTVTCIYYLIKDNTIEGGDLEFEKYNVINIESNMLVIFNGNLTHRATVMNGSGIRKSIVIQFERL